MDHILSLLLGHLDLWTWVIALVAASMQVRRQFTWPRWAEALLIWSAFWVLGVNGCLGFVEHLFFGPFIAERIGWPNSPFQSEVAYANLTIGILGFSSVWLRRRDYLLATMVAYGSWFFADGVGHVRLRLDGQRLRHRRARPGLQAAGSVEAHQEGGALSGCALQGRKLRQLPVLRPAQGLRDSRRRHKPDRLVPDVHDLLRLRSRRRSRRPARSPSSRALPLRRASGCS